MTEYKDFSRYKYWSTLFCVAKNIGWLGEGDFNTGKVDFAFIEKLEAFCCYRVNLTRGFQECPFCGASGLAITNQKGNKIYIGDAEIRVKSKKGRIFAAPTLIIHYVKEHSYLPPQEFIEAIMECKVDWLLHEKLRLFFWKRSLYGIIGNLYYE